MQVKLNDAEILLKDALVEASPSNEHLISRFSKLSCEDLASLFVSGAFLKSILKPLIDQDWLRQHSVPISGAEVSSSDPRLHQMQGELRSLKFISDELVNASSKELKTYFSRTTHFMVVLIGFVKLESLTRFREFALIAMKQIETRSREMDLFPHSPFTEAMYRAFDQMDEILGIQYELDAGMFTDPTIRERLYEGAGAGVQTSYSSILLALDRAAVAPGAHVMDLGSGYGRVGFVLGLLRPDILFTGFEYVDHRVRDSRAVATRAGLASLKFETRDLSASELPRADVYYMYDPFSKETYSHVLNQLISFGREQSVKIITKGRANTWVTEALKDHGWSLDDAIDGGTVHLFVSPRLRHADVAELKSIGT